MKVMTWTIFLSIFLTNTYAQTPTYTIWNDYDNVCFAVNIPKESNEFVTYLGDFANATECADYCVSSSNDTYRCNSCVYFGSDSSSFANAKACYARFNDPMFIPCPNGTSEVTSIYLNWHCRNDLDCSLNGECDKSNGKCKCDAAWKGSQCETLHLLPANKENSGFHQNTTSSWGGSVIYNYDLNDGKTYDMFLSYFPNHCGHSADTVNSKVVHARSHSFDGEYHVVDMNMTQPWSHEPFITRDPQSGKYVLYFSFIRNEPFWPQLCNCTDGTTPPNTCNATRPANMTAEWHETWMMHTDCLDCEWSEIIPLWPRNETGFDTNFVCMILPNGTVYGIARKQTKNETTGLGVSRIYHIRASDWSDPSTYVEEFDNILFENIFYIRSGVEDPFIYRDSNDNYHLLFHNLIPGPGHAEYLSGLHAFSEDGYTWHGPIVAYNNTVEFTDGSTFSFQSRERPHFIFDHKDGVTPIALTNGVIMGSPYEDRSYTLLQPIKT